MTLQEIGQKYGTDKSDKGHSFNGKSYLYWYEKYLEANRLEPITFLEIGVFNGNSLRTWQEYFSNAKICGIDIENKEKHNMPRIKTFQGDQADEQFLGKVISEIGAPHVVLDDGSHINHLTLKSYNYLFDKLAPGGFYIIEDLLCSYHKNIRQDTVQWPGMDKVEALGHKMHNERKIIDDLILNIISTMDHRGGQVEFLHHHSMFMVIKKV